MYNFDAITVIICAVLCALGGYFIIDRVVKTVKKNVMEEHNIVVALFRLTEDQFIVDIVKKYVDSVNIEDFADASKLLDHIQGPTEELIRTEVINRYPAMKDIMTEENVHTVFSLLISGILHTDQKLRDKFIDTKDAEELEDNK